MEPDAIRAVREYIQQIVDGRGKPIDEGIKDAVVALRCHGFQTTGSCEGHLHYGPRQPWVDVGLDGIELELRTDPDCGAEYFRPRLCAQYPTDAAIREGVEDLRGRITAFLDAFYAGRSAASDARLEVRIWVWFEVRISNKGSWWQHLLPLGKAAKLKECQAEMQAFAEFLLAR